MFTSIPLLVSVCFISFAHSKSIDELDYYTMRPKTDFFWPTVSVFSERTSQTYQAGTGRDSATGTCRCRSDLRIQNTRDDWNVTVSKPATASATQTSLQYTPAITDLTSAFNYSSNVASTSVPTSSTSVSTFHVDVGALGNPEFSPHSVNASIGDVLEFNFLGLNHSLTQSSFEHPCIGDARFNTDFHQFNPQNISGKFIVQFQVDAATPQWFHCGQTVDTSHCAAGMVFGLNTNNQMEEFIQKARTTGAALRNTTQVAGTALDSVVPITLITGKPTTPVIPPIDNAGQSLLYDYDGGKIMLLTTMGLILIFF